MLMDKGGKLVALSNLSAVSVAGDVTARVILSDLNVIPVTGDLDAVRLCFDGADLDAVSVSQDLFCHMVIDFWFWFLGYAVSCGNRELGCVPVFLGTVRVEAPNVSAHPRRLASHARTLQGAGRASVGCS